ncbi:MAG: hypothetical protein VZS44_09605 [Bacilli bacterium]|nr:hypothetical protein [Bacilli bacterium]
MLETIGRVRAFTVLRVNNKYTSLQQISEIFTLLGFSKEELTRTFDFNGKTIYIEFPQGINDDGVSIAIKTEESQMETVLQERNPSFSEKVMKEVFEIIDILNKTGNDYYNISYPDILTFKI